MASLSNVCCILDVAGFDIRVSNNGGVSYRNKFLVRELGYIRIDPDQPRFQPVCFRFDLRKEIDMSKLPADVHRTLKYQSQKLIGLSVLPTRSEATKDYGELESVVRDMHRTCQQPGKDIVAYKGGSKEKELLDSLGIPSLDLGLYGCKTYVNLVKDRKVNSPLVSCGKHVGGRDPVQCSMAEVAAYYEWYMDNYKLCKGDDKPEDDFDDEW